MTGAATALARYLALRRGAPNGPALAVLAPRLYPGRGEADSPVRAVAHGLKAGDPRATATAAEAMAPLVPPGATLVPVPGHDGSTRANLRLAEAVARLAGAEVRDGLEREPSEGQYSRFLRGAPRLGPDEIRVRWAGGALRDPVLLVDNVVASGATALAAARALGRVAAVLAWADARHLQGMG